MTLSDLYALCAPAAYHRALGLLGSEADSWDVVHEVFCKLAQGRAFDAANDRPMAYIVRATTNACLNVLAARKVREGFVPGEQSVQGAAGLVHARDLLEKLGPHLDEVDREILVLTFYDGHSQEQIAELLGIWRRTVGRRLSRLRGLLDELERLPLQQPAEAP
jgi:RNA polymerase sigma factor (sigma-70 family)